jgi:hypothetical protein
LIYYGTLAHPVNEDYASEADVTVHLQTSITLTKTDQFLSESLSNDKRSVLTVAALVEYHE